MKLLIFVTVLVVASTELAGTAIDAARADLETKQAQMRENRQY